MTIRKVDRLAHRSRTIGVQNSLQTQGARAGKVPVMRADVARSLEWAPMTDASIRPLQMRVILVCEGDSPPGLVESLQDALPMLAPRRTDDLFDAVFRLSSGWYHAAVIDIDRYGSAGGAHLTHVRRSVPHVWVLAFSRSVPVGEVRAVEDARWLPLVHPDSLADALSGHWLSLGAAQDLKGLQS